MSMDLSFSTIQEINQKSKLIEPGDFVIYIEPGNIEFLNFIKEQDAEILIVSINPRFKGFKTKKCNVMKTPYQEISKKKADLIINELNLDPISSFQALGNVVPLLKDGGKVLISITMDKKDERDIKEMGKSLLAGLKLEPKEFLSIKNEKYIYAKSIV